MPAIAAAPLRRLPRQIHHRPNGPAVLLVVHHVLQALVECGTDEHARLNLLSRQPVVHQLVAVALVPQLHQLSPNGFNVQFAERRAVSEQAQLHQNHAQQRLFQLTDRHARRNGVRVDDDVGTQPLRRERHVAFRDDVAQRALLPVPRAELVPDDRLSQSAHLHLANAVPLPIPLQEIAVNVGLLVRAIRAALILVFQHFGGVVPVDRHHLRNDDVAVLHQRVFRHHALGIHFFIIPEFHALGFGGVGLAAHLFIPVDLLVLVLFGVVNHRLKQAAINGALVHQHAVLLVVARVRHDRHDDGPPRRNLVQLEHAHDARVHQRTRRVRHHVRRLVHALVKIGHVHAHRLLGHRRLVRVPRRLVVLRKRDAGRNHSENGAGMNLAVRVFVFERVIARATQVRRLHGNHAEVLLLGINVFYDRIVNLQIREQIVPPQLLVSQPLDDVLGDEEAAGLAVHAQHGPRDPPRIRANAYFLVLVIKHHRRVNVDDSARFFLLECSVQSLRICGHADPGAVHKHLHIGMHFRVRCGLYRNNE